MLHNLKGKFILIVGPSGSGKSELMAHLVSVHPEYVYPRSATTRKPRPGESSGAKYHFLTDEEFDSAIEAGDTLEWAEFGGRRYATMKSEILPPLREGKTVVREVEIQGARSIMELIPPEVLKIIFIDGGDWEYLRKRIERRAPMSADELERRKQHFEEEMKFKPTADRVIENVDGALEETKSKFIATVEELILNISVV